jgi:hypothetical protein
MSFTLKSFFFDIPIYSPVTIDLSNHLEFIKVIDKTKAENLKAITLPSRIRIDEPINKPNSGTVNFWDEWQEATPANRLTTAVVNWRKQNIQ